MRRLFIGAAVAASLALAACGGSIPNPFTGGTISATDVQNAAVTACGFLPTATTVGDILAAGNPALGTASAIATAICAAVTSKAVKRGDVQPKVSGVAVHGRFVK